MEETRYIFTECEMLQFLHAYEMNKFYIGECNAPKTKHEIDAFKKKNYDAIRFVEEFISQDIVEKMEKVTKPDNTEAAIENLTHIFEERGRRHEKDTKILDYQLKNIRDFLSTSCINLEFRLLYMHEVETLEELDATDYKYIIQYFRDILQGKEEGYCGK